MLSLFVALLNSSYQKCITNLYDITISMTAIALISFVAQTVCVIVRKEHCEIGHHK